MNILFLGSLAGTLLGWLMGFLSIFLILLVLIQRGRGGGLTGALGGAGGQSAFGSKAGDTFTVITIVVAAIWGFTCAFTMWLLGTQAPPAVAEQPAMTSSPDPEQQENGEGANDLLIPTDGGGLSGPQPETTGGDTAAGGGQDLVPAEPQPATDSPSGQDAETAPAEPEQPAAEPQTDQAEPQTEQTEPAEQTEPTEQAEPAEPEGEQTES